MARLATRRWHAFTAYRIEEILEECDGYNVARVTVLGPGLVRADRADWRLERAGWMDLRVNQPDSHYVLPGTSLTHTEGLFQEVDEPHNEGQVEIEAPMTRVE